MAIITPKAACQIVDPTSEAHELEGGQWFIVGEYGQPLAFDSGHLDGAEDVFPTELEAWQAAELFLRDRTPLTA
jgi:hypothetical protein